MDVLDEQVIIDYYRQCCCRYVGKYPLGRGYQLNRRVVTYDYWNEDGYKLLRLPEVSRGCQQFRSHNRAAIPNEDFDATGIAVWSRKSVGGLRAKHWKRDAHVRRPVIARRNGMRHVISATNPLLALFRLNATVVQRDRTGQDSFQLVAEPKAYDRHTQYVDPRIDIELVGDFSDWRCYGHVMPNRTENHFRFREVIQRTRRASSDVHCERSTSRRQTSL